MKSLYLHLLFLFAFIAGSCQMKRHLLTVLLLFTVAFTHAQKNTIDSLQKILIKQKEDTNKVNILLQLAAQFRFANSFSKALEFSKLSLHLSEKIHFVKGKGASYREMGFDNTTLDTAASLQYHQRSLQCFQEIGDKRHIAYSLLYIGTWHYNRRNFSEAL